MLNENDVTADDVEIGPLWYLASPFSRYPGGIDKAAEDVARIAGGLIRRGVSLYCPIAESYFIAKVAGLDQMDHSIWLPFDKPKMDRCDGLLVCAAMPGWAESYGISVEIDEFTAAGKPVRFLV